MNQLLCTYDLFTDQVSREIHVGSSEAVSQVRSGAMKQ
jgi:hypothetical protein